MATLDRIPLPGETLAGVAVGMEVQRLRPLRLPARSGPAGWVLAGGGARGHGGRVARAGAGVAGGALVHRWALREEHRLRERFGDEYVAYLASRRAPRSAPVGRVSESAERHEWLRTHGDIRRVTNRGDTVGISLHICGIDSYRIGSSRRRSYEQPIGWRWAR